MSGPVLVIELAEPVPPTSIQRLRELLLQSSSHFEEKRVGEYDLEHSRGEPRHRGRGGR
ncbi:DUF6368 family protein [Streptomyces niveus]